LEVLAEQVGEGNGMMGGEGREVEEVMVGEGGED
jgi:hypothetical protein